MSVTVYINHKSEIAMAHDSTCSCLSAKENLEIFEEHRTFIEHKEAEKWMNDLLNTSPYDYDYYKKCQLCNHK